MPTNAESAAHIPKHLDLPEAVRNVDESLSEIIRLLYHVLHQHEEILAALAKAKTKE